MNKRIAAAAAVLALSTTLVFAAPGGGHGRRQGGHHGKGGFGEKFTQELNLTEDQQRLIADIRKNSRAQSKELFEKSRELLKEAHAARKANDTAKMETLKPALQAHHAEMKQLRDAEERQILSVLTGEQRAKYETLKAERKFMHENHREHHKQRNH